MKVVSRFIFIVFLVLSFQIFAENGASSSGQESSSAQSQAAKQSANNSDSHKKSDMECVAERNLGYASLAILLGFYILAFNFTQLKLGKETDWSLGKALSETLGEVTTGNPPTLVPSSSRLIAFIGSLVLVGTVFSASFYIVWGLFNCQPMERLGDFGQFLLAGSALFAPYAANKLSELFKVKG